MVATEQQPTVSLANFPGGRSVRIATVEEPHRGALARMGLIEGARLTVESRAPFGGPVIVRLGRSRLAVPLSVAHRVELTAEVAR